jgi:hypothetical protein
MKRPKSSRLRALHFGSGGGIRERASLACATKRSFVANPRAPGYEKVFAFLKTTETSKSYRLTGFSGWSRWVPLVQSDPTSQWVNKPKQPGIFRFERLDFLVVGGATPKSAPYLCRWCCPWWGRWRSARHRMVASSTGFEPARPKTSRPEIEGFRGLTLSGDAPGHTSMKKIHDSHEFACNCISTHV